MIYFYQNQCLHLHNNLVKKSDVIQESYFFFGAAFFAAGFFGAAFFAAGFFAAAIRFHLLPERVIFLINLSIDKYFGHNIGFRHRIAINIGFVQCNMALSGHELI